MSFENGESGNPNGRPKGSYGGRIMALSSLDTLLAKKKNQKALMEALEQDLLEDPVRFFKTVIMPLLPREAKLSFDHDVVVEWKSLLEANAEQAGSGIVPHPHPLPSKGEGIIIDAQEIPRPLGRASTDMAGDT